MIKYRKRIYTLQKSEMGIVRVFFWLVLKIYRLLDIVYFRRAASADLSTEKVVSIEGKFLCVLVPKCGSRTLLDGLLKTIHSDFGVKIVESSIANFITGYDDYYRFAIVRDPWARCYSCYKQKIQQYSAIKGALHFSGREGLFPSMTFSEFVHWLASENGRDDIADRHWLSQYRILGYDLGVTYSKIGRLESLEQDLTAISERLGISSAVFEHKLHTTLPGEYLNNYTPELIELVAQRYARDIEIFMYSRPHLVLDLG
jgi:hypothetical protein